MAYSGKFRPKNKQKYNGDHTKIVYRSLWEKHVMKYLDVSADVIKWSSEEVVIPYIWDIDQKWHRYYMDFSYTTKDGKTHLIEVKPDKQTRKPNYPGRKTKRYITESLEYVKNQNKWEAARNLVFERGWTFEIWTEKTLNSMGIMPKGSKPLKPLKRRINTKKKKTTGKSK